VIPDEMDANDPLITGPRSASAPVSIGNDTDVKELEYFMEDLPLDANAGLTASGISGYPES
jgi:hypothetical protein